MYQSLYLSVGFGPYKGLLILHTCCSSSHYTTLICPPKNQLYYFKDVSCGILNHAIIATLILRHLFENHNDMTGGLLYTTTQEESAVLKAQTEPNGLRVFGRWLNKWKMDGKKKFQYVRPPK